MDKRIVLQHTQGPLKGVHEILGLRSDLAGPPPEVMPSGVTHRGRVITGASLLKVTRTHWLYSEFFNWGRKTNGFNPAQV